jgi:hypothetical protein
MHTTIRNIDTNRSIAAFSDSNLRSGTVKVKHFATVGLPNTCACNGRTFSTPLVIGERDHQFVTCERCAKLAKAATAQPKNYELTAEIKLSVCGVKSTDSLDDIIANLRAVAQNMGIQISEPRVLKVITDVHVTSAVDENGEAVAINQYAEAK